MKSRLNHGVYFSVNDDLIFERFVVQPYRGIQHVSRETVVTGGQNTLLSNKDATNLTPGVFAPGFNLLGLLDEAQVPIREVRTLRFQCNLPVLL